MTLLGQLILSLALSATAQQPIAYQILGRVLDEQGNPRPGATVCAFPVDRSQAQGRKLFEERIRWRLLRLRRGFRATISRREDNVHGRRSRSIAIRR